MARSLSRGEIWHYHFPKPDKKRPVLVLTRDSIIPYLNEVTIAPVTSVIRGIPTEVPVGPAEGLARESVVNLDHLQTVAKSRLKTFLGSASEEKMREIMAALLFALGFHENS